MDDVEGRDEVDAPLVDEVLEGAFGALGDEHWGGGDGVLLSSFVRSMKSCFGGMMTSFCLLEVVELVVFGDDIMECLWDDDGDKWWRMNQTCMGII